MKFCLNGGLLLGTVGMYRVISVVRTGPQLRADGANIEIAEEVGESNVCKCENCDAYFTITDCVKQLLSSFLWPSHTVNFHSIAKFFMHNPISSAVEDLRYQHVYHPVPLEKKCPLLSDVIDEIAGGAFGDAHVYEPYVSMSNSPHIFTYVFRLLNTIKQTDYYLLSEDFESCSSAISIKLALLKLVDVQFLDLAALAMVDEAYLNKEEWIKKSIRTTAKVSVLYRLDITIGLISLYCRWASSVRIVQFLNMLRATGISSRPLLPPNLLST